MPYYKAVACMHFSTNYMNYMLILKFSGSLLFLLNTWNLTPL